jgi:hypothetical protein
MTMKYILAAPVRALVLTMVLLASSGLYPASAQDEGKPPASASQPAPAQTNQNSPPQNDMGRMMDRMGRGMDWDHRKVGHDLRMRRDDDDRDRDRGYRGSDRADRDGYGRGLLRRGSASASGESLLRVRKRRRILPIQRLTTIIRSGTTSGTRRRFRISKNDRLRRAAGRQFGCR